MKIIATSIVVLAAAATTVSAGESNLRLGRNLKGKPEGPKGLAWEWRCCKDIDVAGTCNGIGPEDRNTCKDAGLKEKLEPKFLAGTGFYGCEWDGVENECVAKDEPEAVRHRKLPGKKPNNKGKAKGIGFYCCRPGNGDSGDASDEAEEFCVGVGQTREPNDKCQGLIDSGDFNKCVYDATSGECDHEDLDSLEE